MNPPKANPQPTFSAFFEDRRQVKLEEFRWRPRERKTCLLRLRVLVFVYNPYDIVFLVWVVKLHSKLIMNRILLWLKCIIQNPYDIIFSGVGFCIVTVHFLGDFDFCKLILTKILCWLDCILYEVFQFPVICTPSNCMLLILLCFAWFSIRYSWTYCIHIWLSSYEI